jgi:hypothetical protein
MNQHLDEVFAELLLEERDVNEIGLKTVFGAQQ